MLDKVLADKDSNVTLKMMLDIAQSIRIRMNNDDRLKNFITIKEHHVNMVSNVDILVMLITVMGTRIRTINYKIGANISIIW